MFREKREKRIDKFLYKRKGVKEYYGEYVVLYRISSGSRDRRR